MEFFDRDLPETEAPSRRAEYLSHVDELGLPERLRNLARRDLRDSRLRRIVVDRRTRQVILFLHHRSDGADNGGPNGHELGEGLCDLEILYHRVDLDRLDADLLEARVGDPDTAILADEMDRGEDGLFVHRLLFHPDGELELSFRDAVCVERPADGGAT
jgi:hypothetical protein